MCVPGGSLAKRDPPVCAAAAWVQKLTFGDMADRIDRRRGGGV